MYSCSVRSAGQAGRPSNWRRAVFHTSAEDLSIRSSRKYLEVHARLKRSRGWAYAEIYSIASISERPQKGREIHVRVIAHRGSIALPGGFVVPWLGEEDHFQEVRLECFCGALLRFCGRFSLQLISSASFKVDLRTGAQRPLIAAMSEAPTRHESRLLSGWLCATSFGLESSCRSPLCHNNVLASLHSPTVFCSPQQRYSESPVGLFSALQSWVPWCSF